MRIFSALVAIALACGPVAAAHAGTLYYNEDSNENGLFTLNTLTGLATNVGISGSSSLTVGLAPSADPTTLWGTQAFGLLEIQTDGSGTTSAGGVAIQGLALDPSTNTLYYSANSAFGTLNLATGGVASSLAAAPTSMRGLAWGNGGVYGMNDDARVYFYSPGPDSWAFVGNADMPSGFGKGLAYNPELNILYAISGADEFLYGFNLATNASFRIGDTGRRVAAGGLAYVSAVVPEPGTWALFGLGMLGLTGAVRRRRKQKAQASEQA